MCNRWKLILLCLCSAAALAACAFEPTEPDLAAAPSELRTAGSFPMPGWIVKLVADPRGSFVYALVTGSHSQVIVIDTSQKQELGRVTLPPYTEDLDVSPDGSYLVAPHHSARAISVSDPARLRVTATIPTTPGPYTIEIANDGTAYYVMTDETDLKTYIYRVAVGGGGGNTRIPAWHIYGGNIELSADGPFLYIADWAPALHLTKYDVSGAFAQLVDFTTWSQGPAAYDYRVYLAPGSKHLYYAGYQFDAHNLAFVRGTTGEAIHAEDVTGTFAVGESHIFDAELVRPVATLPHRASAAVIPASSDEIWYYSSDTGQIYYANAHDLIGDAHLGQREIEPGPLASYHFVELIHDPARPRLYGLDAAQGAVVAIDAVTLQPTRTIRVGTAPTDLAVSPDGSTLFVGNVDAQAFIRIDLDTLTFSGLVQSPTLAARLVAVADDRLVTIDDRLSANPMLVDADTGETLSQAYGGTSGSALSATADGKTVFVGASSWFAQAIRFSVDGDEIVRVGDSEEVEVTTPRSIIALPDGSGVYYAGRLLDGNDLNHARYSLPEPILAVTPDGRLALSDQSIYDTGTGTYLRSLPARAEALAISPDGALVFLAANGGIRRVRLGDL
ncbi:MAG TPA: hypothetical protein VNO30_01580 [Kofleriaceae bacterium]|nr:hypothetical protein [Kofleriaceae bacterium]